MSSTATPKLAPAERGLQSQSPGQPSRRTPPASQPHGAPQTNARQRHPLPHLDSTVLCRPVVHPCAACCRSSLPTSPRLFRVSWGGGKAGSACTPPVADSRSPQRAMLCSVCSMGSAVGSYCCAAKPCICIGHATAGASQARMCGLVMASVFGMLCSTAGLRAHAPTHTETASTPSCLTHPPWDGHHQLRTTVTVPLR
jgi:hypothetical protein